MKIFFTVIFFSLFNSVYCQNCLGNLIDNHGFEEGIQYTSEPLVLDNGALIEGNWYQINSTVDIMHSNSPDNRSSVSSASLGSQWLGIWGNNNEIIGTRLNSELIPGIEYTLKFSAAGNSNPKIKLTLSSNQSNITSTSQLNNAQEIGELKLWNNDWKEFEFVFIANASHKHLIIEGIEPFFSGSKYASLDEFELKKKGEFCCQNNLIQYPGFEIPRTIDCTSNWKNLHNPNFIWCTMNNSDPYWYLKGPVTSTHSLINNEKWMVLNSWDAGYNSNQAVAARLKGKLVPGQTYLVSFYGATRRAGPSGAINWASRSHLSVKFTTWPITDWQENIGGTPVFDNYKFTGPHKEWVEYKLLFVPQQSYEYIVIQSKAGHDPAIDDICVRPYFDVPYLQRQFLFYNTNNSTFSVDENTTQTLINYNNSNDLFGLEVSNGSLYVNNNQNDVFSIIPESNWWEMNPISTISTMSMSTDIVNINSDLFISANNKIYKIENYPSYTGGQNVVEILFNSNITNPFSIANKENYLFILGEDKLEILNLNSFAVSTINNHGIIMGGYMTFDSRGALYICDPGDDSIKKLGFESINDLINDFNNGLSLDYTFTVLSQGNLIEDQVAGTESLIRGPIGIDEYQGDLFVTVDTGSGLPGKIIRVDSQSGNQMLFKDFIQGPRAIKINEW